MSTAQGNSLGSPVAMFEAVLRRVVLVDTVPAFEEPFVRLPPEPGRSAAVWLGPAVHPRKKAGELGDLSVRTLLYAHRSLP